MIKKNEAIFATIKAIIAKYFLDEGRSQVVLQFSSDMLGTKYCISNLSLN